MEYDFLIFLDPYNFFVQNTSMSQIDIVKETIAYLKFWLGVMVVSDITLVGWLLSNAGKASDLKT